ncbi:unnamed protein product [Symbiodinium natans]|uniref:Uncharacterized protein n=1 Tax=Symbiodinium natans TaxID=878477 RepID=A0A812I026_9DINO|nr:unnamed protein product [Symbiodinium natans]
MLEHFEASFAGMPYEETADDVLLQRQSFDTDIDWCPIVTALARRRPLKETPDATLCRYTLNCRWDADLRQPSGVVEVSDLAACKPAAAVLRAAWSLVVQGKLVCLCAPPAFRDSVLFRPFAAAAAARRVTFCM